MLKVENLHHHINCMVSWHHIYGTIQISLLPKQIQLGTTFEKYNFFRLLCITENAGKINKQTLARTQTQSRNENAPKMKTETILLINIG